MTAMGVQDGKQNYENNIDGDSWKDGVQNSGSDWGSGVSEAGSRWSDGADSDSWASGIEDDPETDGTVPDSVKTDYESRIQQSEGDFEDAGNNSENQSNYEDGADEDSARDYASNADGDSWASGYTDLSSWGS